jgi:hypothetical protein
MKDIKSNFAEWVMDRECPNCENGGMLVRDKYGIFCVVSGCGWKGEDIPDVKRITEHKVNRDSEAHVYRCSCGKRAQTITSKTFDRCIGR